MLVMSAPEEIRTPNLLIRSQMLYPLSYGRMCSVVWLQWRRREDLNLRSPVRGQLISSESHSAALARLLELPEGTGPSQGTGEPPRSTGYTAHTYAVEMTARLRPELAELPGYVEGKTVAGAIKLASNETVHGPLPSVRTAVEQAIANVNRYPDNHNVKLRSRLAQHLDSAGCGGIAPEQIAVGCGSASLCQQLIQIRRVGGRRGALRMAQLRDVSATGADRRRHPDSGPAA